MDDMRIKGISKFSSFSIIYTTILFWRKKLSTYFSNSFYIFSYLKQLIRNKDSLCIYIQPLANGVMVKGHG